ncbi:MAG: decaprenyl-phosphate phosphoribosyltransferase [Thermoleophilia bacterium]
MIADRQAKSTASVETDVPLAHHSVATASALLRSVRPRQWTKNLVVLAPLVFSFGLTVPALLVRAIVAFGLFCALSGAVYLSNDIIDAKRDRLSADTCRRPLAAGEIGRRPAAALAAVLATASLAGGLLLSPSFALACVAYLALQAAYVLVLRERVILDVMAIAAGFVVRVVAGAVVIGATVSPWLLLCTALLALFLALVKRRHELLVNGQALQHRPALRGYSAALLDQMIAAITAATVVIYSIYTFSSHEAAGSPYLMLTIPFVVYGLLRYLYLAHARNLGGSPEEVLLKDTPLIADLALWAGTVIMVLYVA